MKAVREGKWDEFETTHPHVNGKIEKPEEPAAIPSQYYRNANIYDLCLYPERKNIQEIISISQEMKTVSHVMKPVTREMKTIYGFFKIISQEMNPVSHVMKPIS